MRSALIVEMGINSDQDNGFIYHIVIVIAGVLCLWKPKTLFQVSSDKHFLLITGSSSSKGKRGEYSKDIFGDNLEREKNMAHLFNYSQLSNKSTVGNKSTATTKFLFQAIVPLN